MEELALQPGEHVLQAVRKHWLVYLGYFIPYLVFAYIPVFALQLLSSKMFATAPWAAKATITNPMIAFALGFWLLFVWMAAYSNFLRNFLDVWIITNKRIVDIEQVDFFRREITSLFLDRIEDVQVHEEGFFNTLFGFGTIIVQSAGATEHSHITGIPGPKHLRDVIMQQVDKFEEHKQHVIVEQTKG